MVELSGRPLLATALMAPVAPISGSAGSAGEAGGEGAATEAGGAANSSTGARLATWGAIQLETPVTRSIAASRAPSVGGADQHPLS